jgi:hypothetical protein
MKPVTWSAEDGERLKALRTAAQIDITTLARHHTLSLSQIRQLEEGGNSTFYSQEIKLNAGRKLLHALGFDMPTVPQSVQHLDEAGIKTKELAPLIGVPKRPVSSVKDTAQRMAGIHGQALLALLLVAGIAGYYLWRGSPSPRMDVRTAGSSQQLPVASPENPKWDVKTSEMPRPEHILDTAISPGVEKNTNKPGDCEWRFPEKILASPQPVKPGNYVYVVALSEIQVCVLDARMQETLLNLKPGQAKSVYGHSPFKVYSTSYKDVKLFYQGHQVRMPEVEAVSLSLNEQKWTQP